MVVVEFDYNDFKDIFGVEKEKTIAALTDIGAPTEVDPETGKLFVEVTPNRPDWYSVLGLARAIRSYYKRENKKYTVKKGEWKVVVEKKVDKIRPYTVNAVIKGLTLNDLQIKDMVLLQEKLLATLGRRVKRFGIGIYPLDKIKFPVRYTTMKPKDIVYQPLSYPKKADAIEILKKHPKGQDYGYIIGGYDEFPVYVDADNEIMALIPIVNSEETGKVDETTKDIFIEVSGNDMVGINQALNVLVCHFIDLGGIVYDVEVEYADKKIRSPKLDYEKVELDEKRVKDVLGVEIKKDEIKKMLEKMGYVLEGGDVFIQPYRTDILLDVDVIEDIAIIYGYNMFEPTVPDFFYPGKKNGGFADTGAFLRNMGFVEVSTPILTNKETLSMFGYNGVGVLNPKTKEYTVLRSSIIPNMVEVLFRNRMKGIPQMVYEIGKILDRKEETRLCFVIVDRALEFSTARGHLQSIMKHFENEFELKEADIVFFDNPYSAEILIKGKKVGVFGRLNKEISGKFAFEFPVYLCEISI